MLYKCAKHFIDKLAVNVYIFSLVHAIRSDKCMCVHKSFDLNERQTDNYSAILLQVCMISLLMSDSSWIDASIRKRR